MKRRTKVLGAVAAVGVAATFTLSGIAQSGTTVPRRMSQLDAAPKKDLGPGDPIIMGVYRNNKFYVVHIDSNISTAKMPDGTSVEIHSTGPSIGGPPGTTPDGKMSSVQSAASRQVEAQLPPADRNLPYVTPTEAQIAANSAAVDAEVARTRTVNPGPQPPGPQKGTPPAP